jgi:hypothetical protein
MSNEYDSTLHENYKLIRIVLVRDSKGTKTEFLIITEGVNVERNGKSA